MVMSIQGNPLLKYSEFLVMLVMNDSKEHYKGKTTELITDQISSHLQQLAKTYTRQKHYVLLITPHTDCLYQFTEQC